MRHLYQRSVSYMDAWLADVLQALDARGILEQTLVIVTSDHGENFGEHGLIAHAFSINEHLVHVPLVMAGPGADGPPELMSLAEMPRLIAAAAGIEDHPWGDDELPAGAAIAQCDPMAPATDARMRNFAKTYHVSDSGLSPLVSTFSAATDGHHKLLVRDGVESLVDLDADPGELRPREPDVSDAAVAALRDALAHPASGASGEPAPAAVTGGAGGASPEELAAIERQMKLLGYM
jgi:arylsulfatase A-like enzyme